MPEEHEADEPGLARPDYEPPKLTVIGTVADLTQGTTPITTDGIFPGSIL